MTDDATMRPEQATAPAFSVPATRDLDGGLLTRFTYALTPADALAYLRLRREWPGWAKVGLGLWFLLGGALFGLLPDRLIGQPDTLRHIATFLAVLALQFALLVIAINLWNHHRARRMVPNPRPGVFEEWTDGIAATRIDTPDQVFLSHDQIGQVLDTATHIFILNRNTTIVIPTQSLAEPAALADHLRELARRSD